MSLIVKIKEKAGYVFMIAGFLSIILSFLLSLGWYIQWLENNLFGTIFSYIVGIMTIYLLPLAIIIEFIMNKWPKEVNVAVIFNFLGLFFMIVGSNLKRDK